MNRRIDKLTVEDLQNIINEKCSSYYTAKDVRDLLSNLYKRAMASNHSPVNQNLSRHLVLPDLEEKESEPFTETEVNAIWKAYNAGDLISGFTLLMIYTGMMPGELMKLKKDMIDLENLEIRGAGAKTKVRKKAVIVFPEFLKPVIESLMDYDRTSDKLYPVNKDRFYEQYYASLERAQTRKLPPYSCRHTFGTEIVKAGLHPAMVQKLLRHSNQKTQEKYTHLSATDEHNAVNGLQMANN
jgi:integrase